MKPEIRYGKAEIRLYRTHARPLPGVRSNTLFGAEVRVDVYGDNFLAAYTEGDNTEVVATDTIKNFTYAMALEFTGATPEGFAAFLARRFLEAYPQMQRVAVRVRELPFAEHSEKLLSPLAGDHGLVEVDADRSGVQRLEAGRGDLRLVKLTGSSFAHFARDRYTTLPERADRPLFIHLDLGWRYRDPEDGLSEDLQRYVPSEHVAQLVLDTFDQFVSLSIQHLVHEMGQRILARWAQLDQVRLEAQNRLWDTSAVSETDPRVKVYSDPKPAYGLISLTLKR
ncbi:MAG TPA: urate oxidase [Candidatus Acidoferrales bacterium]|nr:urate oxidase [Candidatus Acidoferrales bacterium]